LSKPITSGSSGGKPSTSGSSSGGIYSPGDNESLSHSTKPNTFGSSGGFYSPGNNRPSSSSKPSSPESNSGFYNPSNPFATPNSGPPQTGINGASQAIKPLSSNDSGASQSSGYSNPSNNESPPISAPNGSTITFANFPQRPRPQKYGRPSKLQTTVPTTTTSPVSSDLNQYNSFPAPLYYQSSSSPSVPNPTPQGISAGPAPFTFYTGISSNSLNGNGLSPFSDEDMGFELMEETPEEEEVEPNRSNRRLYNLNFLLPCSRSAIFNVQFAVENCK